MQNKPKWTTSSSIVVKATSKDTFDLTPPPQLPSAPARIVITCLPSMSTHPLVCLVPPSLMLPSPPQSLLCPCQLTFRPYFDGCIPLWRAVDSTHAGIDLQAPHISSGRHSVNFASGQWPASAASPVCLYRRSRLPPPCLCLRQLRLLPPPRI